jgi:hypothetical protein
MQGIYWLANDCISRKTLLYEVGVSDTR